MSATGWGKLVSIALDLHNKQRFGSQYHDPEGVFTTIVGMLGFVDDNNISNTGKKHESIEDVIKRTQHDAQLWSDILKATKPSIPIIVVKTPSGSRYCDPNRCLSCRSNAIDTSFPHPVVQQNHQYLDQDKEVQYQRQDGEN